MIEASGLLLAAVVLLDILLVGVRASLLNSRSTYLVMLREQHQGPVDRTLALLARPRLRASLRLAVVFFHFIFSGLVFFLAERWLLPLVNTGQTAVTIAFGVLILAGGLLLMLEYALEGRILPNPESWALALAPLGALVDFLLTPVSALLLALLGYTAQPNNASEMTEDDLRNWVEVGRPEGSLEKEERKMIYSIFHFGETLAREIMVPRIDILALDITATLAEAFSALSKSGHSRVPVYEETVDNIIGLLYAKDLLGVHRAENEILTGMRELIRPAYFVPEAKKADDLLTEMQTRRIHMAIVVDEYGGVAGLVTLEDIMEEIIGEIQDEYDQAEEMLYQQVNANEYLFLGRIDLNDFNEIMGSHLEKESTDTLGGFIYNEIGRVPTGGESIEADGVVLTVEQVSKRRIRKVRARKHQPTEEMEVEQSDAD